MQIKPIGEITDCVGLGWKTGSKGWVPDPLDFVMKVGGSGRPSFQSPLGLLREQHVPTGRHS